MAHQLDPLESLLARVERAYPSAEQLRSRLVAGKPVRAYHGIDPTSSVLHLGHTVPLRLLKQLQELGHTAIVLIGDFTATVGDPSGRDSQRTVLPRDEVDDHVLALREQIGRVLDLQKTEVRFNSEWFDDVSTVGNLRRFLEVIGSRFTAAQLWERDLFQVRQEKQQPVSVTEFLYPTLQAYDSVALDADIEVGGSDQTFNMLAGRTLTKQVSGRDKFVLTTPLILGTDGRKMSKSYGNTIGVVDEPLEMYGKLMAIPDDQIVSYTLLLTDRFIADREQLEGLVRNQPRDAKAMLAREVVILYHGVAAATDAEAEWVAQFQQGAEPTRVPEVYIDEQPRDVAGLIVAVGAARSRSEAARLVEQGGVSVDGTKQADPMSLVPLVKDRPLRLKVGPRRYYDVRRA